MKIFLTGSTGYLGTKFIEMYGSKYDILGASLHDPTNPINLLDQVGLEELYNDFAPDVIIHLAAAKGRDETIISSIVETGSAILQNLINLALPNSTPLILTSSEAFYGGRWDAGGYKEVETAEPRSINGEWRVVSERLLADSGLPYLITRGHRYVGIWSADFNKKKQFPDTLRALQAGKAVHLDSKKVFTPTLINHICDVINHYLETDMDKKIMINVGTDKKTTYYDFMLDVATKLELNKENILSDGDEAGWPQNSSLNFEKIAKIGYPTVSYNQLLETIKSDFERITEI